MGATYTRQSTYADGDTITADHTNDEFDQLLAAFAASTGHTHDGTTAEGGPITKLLGTSLTLGNGASGTDITVTFDGESNDGVLKWMEDEDYFEFSDDILIATTEKIQFRDTAIFINSSADGQLDIVADTEIQIAATTIDINGAADISGNLAVGGNLTVAGNATVTGTTTFNGGTLTLGDSAADNVVFGADVNSSIIPNTDSTFDLGSASQEWRDLYIDGTAHIDTLDVDVNATVAGTLAVTGVATVGGLTIGSAVITEAELEILDGANVTTAELNILDGVTSTAAELNILDGVTSTTAELNILDGVTSTTAELNILDGVTSTAAELNILDVSNSTIGDLTEISTAANDDVFLALDTSGGGLKKITRSTILAGTGSSSDLANIVEDTTPQLGGNLDMNGKDIVTLSNATIDLAPHGTGAVVVRGNTNSAKIVFNCESNSHGQTVQAQPHSASATNTMLLPEGSSSTLLSRVSTDTLTNKTLTSPKINEDVAVTSTATELNLLDGVTSTTAELNILDGVTSTAAELNLLDGVTSTTAELNILDGVTSTAAELNILDGVTSTAAELNILDGVTSTAAELNSLDGITAVVGELNALDIGSTAVGTAVASKAVILDSNKDYTGIRNFTITGELDAATLDISGAIDVAGTSNLDVVDIDGAVDMASTLQVDGIATFTAIPVANAGLSVKNGSTTAGFVSFFEDSDNGNNSVKLIGPASTADVTLTLPAVTGTVATTGDITALAIALG